ncbi:leishmanolysin [Limibaculum sp. FT325]|uniref:leishmanolysin n=1 Tax=Thermohalobaculum sediminis TaxID=2939436 RepID=UPI0020C0D5B9|nr:leishmanolysin [Limibaculum sediminis]MCL5777212.1 leishmanolysin [Limibaculum sediminis]
MSTASFDRLTDLSVLFGDTFLLVDAPEETPIDDGQEFGFDLALDKAVEGAFALDWASNAPSGSAPEFELPIQGNSASNTPDLIMPNEIAYLDDWGLAKPDGTGGGGGGGGKSGGGGGGGGGGGKNKNTDTTDPGTTDPTPSDPLLSSYTSKEGSADSSFNVTVDFLGDGWTVALQEDFVAAADFISSIILADIPNVFVPGIGTVDDILIQAQIVDIDGSGGVLGRAGPTSYRTSSYLPATAIMEFDVADAEYFDSLGLFDDIVLHEMMHSIGFGTMWSYMGLTSGSIAGGNLRFTGDLATAYYNTELSDIATKDALSDTGVPVETDGGSGTAGGHWDETTFKNELMTGYINSSNYLSMMSVAALEDMGYDTIIDDPNDPNDLSGTLLLA